MARSNRLLLDVTPLQTAHRHRGIGTYCAGLLSGLLAIGVRPETWGFRDRLIRIGPRPDVGPARWDPRSRATSRRVARLEGLCVDRGTRLHVMNPEIGGLPIPSPYVTTAYDLIPLLHAEHYLSAPGDQERYADYLDHLQGAGTVVAISQATRRALTEHAGVNPERVVVALPGLPELPEPEARARGEGAFLVVGTPEPHKNLRFAIEVVAALPPGQRRPLVATGASGDPRWADLEQAAADRGVELRVMGRVSRSYLAGLYRSVDAVLVPSEYEGFGLPALEALSVGAWVIVSDRGALPEAVGSVGRVVPLDIQAWMEALSAGPPTRAERYQAIAHARSFGWEDTAVKVVEAWGSVA